MLDVIQKPAAISKTPGLESTDMPFFSYVKIKSELQRDGFGEEPRQTYCRQLLVNVPCESGLDPVKLASATRLSF